MRFEIFEDLSAVGICAPSFLFGLFAAEVVLAAEGLDGRPPMSGRRIWKWVVVLGIQVG
jgi:hypothetical protein